MKNRHFFFLFVSIFTSIIIMCPIGNYLIDYYSVFRGAKCEIIESNQINDRFVKMEYLLADDHLKTYDSYLWGSSRVQKMDTKITGKRTYNLGASAGMPEDCLRELIMLKNHGAIINTVYLGLDDFCYWADYDRELSVIYRIPYTDSKLQNCQYYATLLVSGETIKLKAKEDVKKRFMNDISAKTILHTTGMYLVPQSVEINIENNATAYVENSKFKEPMRFSSGGNNRFDTCLKVIRQIKQFCDLNHIQFIPFFNPQHMTTYLADDMQLMNHFKKELAKISPFWDFSGVNYVTANNYFWYETSHPRAFICDKILDMVSGQNQMAWVPDFGVYVTPENVDAFCEKAVRDREAYDPDHAQWIPTAEERAVMSRRLHVH